MALNICDGFSLAFGSPSVSVDLVAANSSESSDPKVVGTIQNTTDWDRSPPGSVSDTVYHNAQVTDFPRVDSPRTALGRPDHGGPRGQHNDARWGVPRPPEGVEGFRQP